jgi:hypothetical protein
LTTNSRLQSSSTVVAFKDGFVEAEIDDEILTLNVDRGICYGLNRVGSSIWKLLAEPIRVRDLCTTLLGTYRVDPDDCEQQVLELLEELCSEGLIRSLDDQ